MSEYYDAMITLLELMWGKGFMAPGGEGNVAKQVDGLDLKGKRVLDIGCGLGGPDYLLAGKYGARVTGIDLEEHLVRRAIEGAAEFGLEGQTEFLVVEPGPLDFPDAAFDVVLSSGAFTQIAEKKMMFRECLRVLRPGGALTSYDWMKSEGEYSDDMLYFFEMEGLTYAMDTIENHRKILEEVGFEEIELTDASHWYRHHVHREYEQLRGELNPEVVRLIGQDHADYFVEDWRAMMVVCEKGEMKQVYLRARKPNHE
ncbi:MAG: methyltransferase domain-containing protein [Woeseia sp.]